MKTKLAQDLSANVVQLVLNQLFGLIIFYILSTGLDKNNFGQINFALAILLAAFNILSLGIDQLIVKKVAAGDPVQTALSLYIFHVLTAGVFFYGVLLSGKFLFHQTGAAYSLILLIGIGKLMTFFSTPFKQVSSGLEKFRLLAYMSVTSNIFRAAGLVLIALTHSLSIKNIVIIFISGDVAELLVCVYLFKSKVKTPMTIKWDKINYLLLLRESIPQTGVVLITSALARFDWIFIGILLSSVKLAEYSFAYKVFEISTLPQLAIAPLLIPRFTRLFKKQNINVSNLVFLIRVELIVAVFTALLLNICWQPVIDYITAGKYGQVNSYTIFILSLCMPFLYANNFLWTIYFSQGRLKMILTAFVITLLVNVIGDLVLIPIYKNEGAAFAFLLSCIAQTAFFLSKNEIAQFNIIWRALVAAAVCAFVGGYAAIRLSNYTYIQLPVAVVIFVALLFITSQLKISDRSKLSGLLDL